MNVTERPHVHSPTRYLHCTSSRCIRCNGGQLSSTTTECIKLLVWSPYWGHTKDCSQKRTVLLLCVHWRLKYTSGLYRLTYTHTSLFGKKEWSSLWKEKHYYIFTNSNTEELCISLSMKVKHYSTGVLISEGSYAISLLQAPQMDVGKLAKTTWFLTHQPTAPLTHRLMNRTRRRKFYTMTFSARIHTFPYSIDTIFLLLSHFFWWFLPISIPSIAIKFVWASQYRAGSLSELFICSTTGKLWNTWYAT